MSSALRPGSRVGPCILVEAIGRGGAGVVWNAQHDRLGTVALKLLRVYDPGLSARLGREARLQARIDSPNVVRVLDVFEHGGCPAVVLELVPGRTLLGLLRERRLELDEVDGIAGGLFEGLAAAHAVGIVHRDLKLSNVLLAGPADALQPKLADFGLARADEPEPGGDPLTHTGMIMGTPGYMAPEQIDDPRTAGAAADVFALGVLLYRMVTGTMPFHSASRFEVYRRTRAGECLPAEELRPDLPPRMAGALRAAMQTDPARRPDLAGVAALWRGEQTAPQAPEPDLDDATVLEATPRLARPPAGVPRPARPLLGRVRERELAVQRLDAGFPVVTLLGTAGVGKTHLARTLASERPGARFVDLSGARDAADLAAAVGESLGLPFREDAPHARIGRALAEAGGLVVLDQPGAVAEPLLEALRRWRIEAPDVQFLLVTRLFLGVPGEAVVELNPLEPGEAVAFFVACAQEVKPAFRADEPEVLHALVERLGRLPLALQLAAARVRMLPPARLLERLGDRLNLLRSGRRGDLDEAVAFSWSLLPAWGQRALSACAGFEGGFTLAAAEDALEQVLEPFVDAPWPMDALEVLVDHSLVCATEPLPGLERYAVPEAVRVYALDQELDAERSARRRAAWFARFGAGAAMRLLTGPGGVARTRALWLERGNLRAAAEQGLRDGDAEVASGAALAAAWLHRGHGPYADGARLLERVLALEGIPTDRRARLLRNRGRLLALGGRPTEAQAALTEALSRFEEVGDARSRGIVLGNLGDLAFDRGDAATARGHYAAALEVLTGAGDAESEAAVRGNLANLLRHAGDAAGARGAYERALALSRSVGDRRGEAVVLANLASLHMDSGRLSLARAAYSDAIDRVRELEDRSTESLLLNNRALLDRQEGRTAEARAGFESAIALAEALGSGHREALARGNLGDLLLELGEPAAAQAQLERAVALADASFPLAAGAFRGSLALLAGRAGDFERALELLDVGERQLTGVDAGELEVLRGKRAAVLALRG